jgi:hypothetical protein
LPVFAILSEFQHGHRFTPICDTGCQTGAKPLSTIAQVVLCSHDWILSRKPVDKIAWRGRESDLAEERIHSHLRDFSRFKTPLTLSELRRELAADNRNRARIADVTQPESDLLRLWRGLVGELLYDLAALEDIAVARKVRFVSSGFIFSGYAARLALPCRNSSPQYARPLNSRGVSLGDEPDDARGKLRYWHARKTLGNTTVSSCHLLYRVFKSPLSARKILQGHPARSETPNP